MTSSVRPLRRALKKSSPGLRHERSIWELGQSVAGMDEVGRGAWAGPLTVGAVIVPEDRRIYKIRDSKMLTENEREAMFERIAAWCTAWSVGHAWPEECDEMGMSEAQRLAARRALEGLGRPVDRVLLDGKWDFIGGGRATTIVKGDRVSLSIAAASILAKVTRDRLMRDFDEQHPWYSFADNKGYPCPRHRAVLRSVGVSAIHRRSWAFMDDLEWQGTARRGFSVEDDRQGRLFD